MDPSALMDLLGFSTGEVERFSLIMTRLSGLFLAAPFFSRAVGPQRIRVSLIMALGFLLLPLTPPWSGEGKGDAITMVLAGVNELLVGALMGLLVHWALMAMQLAGSLIGVEIGLSMAEILDPTSGMQEGVLSNLLYLTALMIFLAIDGHHTLLTGLARSFHTLPIGAGLPPAEGVLEAGVTAVTQFFTIGFLVAAPVIVASKLLYLGLGLINRASPQIQVFFVAMPVSLVLGFLVMGLAMTVMGRVVIHQLDGFFTLAFKVVGM